MNRSQVIFQCGWLLVVVALIGCADSADYVPYQDAVREHTLSVGGNELVVEVASTPAQRQQGLMYRESLPEGRGMLFLHPAPRILRFWMKNTYVPLSIAFIDTEGTIVNIEDMNPLEEVPGAVSLKPVPYALEVPQGWFRENSVQAGDRIEFPDWLAEVVVEG
jgi:uncharacterized membrane protein (UPF0127 family)